MDDDAAGPPGDEVRAARDAMVNPRGGTYTYTEEERAEARRLYETGMGHNAIARYMGWPAARMAQLTKEEGFEFAGKARTRAATETLQARREGNREALKAKLLRVTNRYLDRLDDDSYTLVYVSPRDGAGEAVVSVAPGYEARDLSVAARQLLACVEQLEKAERAREDGVAEVDEFLDAIAGDGDGDLGLEPVV